MTKIAFCFPGQGSLEQGMGREIAEAVPEAMEVFERGSEACGLDLQRLCFEAPLKELVETEVQQPALVATSLAVLAALRARGIKPDYVVGHSVGEFAALRRGRVARDPGDDRARPRARASRWPRRRSERPGLDGRDPRPRRRGRRADLPQDPRRVAGELQLPRPDRRLGRERRRSTRLRRGRAGGRAPRGQAAASRARSTAARRARGRPAAAGDRRVKFAEPAAPFMSTVTARFEDGAADGPAARRPADRAGPLHAGGARADQGRRAHVRRGRARATCSPAWSSGSTAA